MKIRNRHHLHRHHHQEMMDRKKINIIILLFVFGMTLYHIIPSEYLIGRFIYYISLYGSITGFLFHLRFKSLEKKYRRYYLVASFYSIGKMFYHLWMVIVKYKYDKYAVEYENSLIEYKKGLIDYEGVLIEYNKTILEYKFNILGIECELFASIFTCIALVILICFSLNNKYG